MQKAPRAKLRRYRLLLWCLALSLLIHFVVVPLIVGLLGLHHALVEPKEVTYQVSSALRLSRAPKPRPPAHPRIRMQPQPRAVQRERQRVQPQPATQPHELAKIEPRAQIAVPRLSTPIDFARQQQQFERTIAQLRRQSDPVVGAARPVAPAAAPKHYAFDFSGSVGTSPQSEGILYPVKSWHDGPYTYYYVRYWVQYADGSVETGYVPWPLRYLPQSDPFLLHWEHFPLPAPLPDYVLPPDTNLHPLVAFCYEHRSDFSTCPIHHD
ncbi:MAG TPA: hypothetical protein VJP85_03070 [Candidatus Baltobacteraceae bacterium]|nr:hypothetical protein [Candidatus Baltobacteraceae bacterium]